MKIKELSIKGCLLIEYAIYTDERGTFVKTFNRDLFKGTPLEKFSTEEEFFTQSVKNVIRGLHFQIPPFSHNKIVSCSLGKITDVLLDLRVSSSTYGTYCAVDLSSKLYQSLYIPVGVAHGFISRSEASIVCYKVDKKYSSAHDAGVAWDSFSFDWGTDTPILSTRDRAFPSLAKFKSPF